MRVVLVRALLSEAIKLKAALSLPQISLGPQSSKNKPPFLWIDRVRQQTHGESSSSVTGLLWAVYSRLSSNRHPSLLLLSLSTLNALLVKLSFFQESPPIQNIFFFVWFNLFLILSPGLSSTLSACICFGIRSFHFPSPPISEESHMFWHADALRSFSSSSSTSSSSTSSSSSSCPLIVLLISAYEKCESLSVWCSDVGDRLLFYWSTLAVKVKSSPVHLEPQITNACVHPCV